jgi:hypothetical protein
MPSKEDACALAALARMVALRRLVNEIAADCVHCPCHRELLPILAKVKDNLDEGVWALSAFEHSEP